MILGPDGYSRDDERWLRSPLLRRSFHEFASRLWNSSSVTIPELAAEATAMTTDDNLHS